MQYKADTRLDHNNALSLPKASVRGVMLEHFAAECSFKAKTMSEFYCLGFSDMTEKASIGKQTFKITNSHSFVLSSKLQHFLSSSFQGNLARGKFFKHKFKHHLSHAELNIGNHPWNLLIFCENYVSFKCGLQNRHKWDAWRRRNRSLPRSCSLT